MRPAIATRRATPEDVDTVLADVQAGFDSYAAFAPLGWRPPCAEFERDRTIELLADPRTWAIIARAHRHPVGHIAFVAGRERVIAPPLDRPEIRGLAHLWQLFVLPDWWGRGVAPLLHDAAIEEMRDQGYERARLYTPSLHARARRFYERRGWTPVGEEWNDGLALMLTEYRLVLR